MEGAKAVAGSAVSVTLVLSEAQYISIKSPALRLMNVDRDSVVIVPLPEMVVFIEVRGMSTPLSLSHSHTVFELALPDVSWKNPLIEYSPELSTTIRDAGVPSEVPFTGDAVSITSGSAVFVADIDRLVFLENNP